MFIVEDDMTVMLVRSEEQAEHENEVAFGGRATIRRVTVAEAEAEGFVIEEVPA